MNPRITISDNLLDSYNLEESRGNNNKIYLVEVKENNLGMIYFIYESEKKEFTLRRHNILTLYGVDEDAEYPLEKPIGKLCDLDPYMEEVHFKKSIEPYGIGLKKVEIINMNQILSFHWTIETEKEKELMDLIAKKFNNQNN